MRMKRKIECIMLVKKKVLEDLTRIIHIDIIRIMGTEKKELQQ